jgi:hypothetical protein
MSMGTRVHAPLSACRSTYMCPYICPEFVLMCAGVSFLIYVIECP